MYRDVVLYSHYIVEPTMYNINIVEHSSLINSSLIVSVGSA